MQCLSGDLQRCPWVCNGALGFAMPLQAFAVVLPGVSATFLQLFATMLQCFQWRPQDNNGTLGFTVPLQALAAVHPRVFATHTNRCKEGKQLAGRAEHPLPQQNVHCNPVARKIPTQHSPSPGNTSHAEAAAPPASPALEALPSGSFPLLCSRSKSAPCKKLLVLSQLSSSMCHLWWVCGQRHH